MKSIWWFIICSISAIPISAQLENGSALPILHIETNGALIQDEPKIESTLTIYYENGAEVNLMNPEFIHYEGLAGIEKRGQSSMQFPKVGYGLETRNDDGSNRNVPLFGWPKENDWVMHGPYSDKTLIRNAFSYKLASQVFDYAPRTMFCEVIINDSYEGIYLFTEKIKRDAGRVDISKLKTDDLDGDQLTGGYIIKFDKGSPDEYGWSSPVPPPSSTGQTSDFYIHYPKPENLQVPQRNYIQTVVDDFEQKLISSEFADSLDGYRQHIDEQSFIDYMLIQELTGNIDAYRLSTYFYKDRDSIDSRLRIGPVWDFNLAFGNAYYCNGDSHTGWRWNFNDYCNDDDWLNHFWWTRFLQDDYFKKTLQETWVRYRSTIWTEEKLMNCIDSLTQRIEPAVDRNFERWPVIGEWVWPNVQVESSYEGEVSYLKNWLRNRIDWMDQAIDNFILGTELEIDGEGIELSPNPNHGSFTIKWNRKIIQPEEILLFDTYGKLIAHRQNIFGADINQMSFEEILLPGVYYYTVASPIQVISGSFLVW